MKIDLDAPMQALRTEIEELVQKVRKSINDSREREDISSLVDEMGKKAHDLHVLLTNNGTEPIHHKYMIENRNMKPDDPEFYMHIHPVEDLLAFLDDSNANNDPEDKTIGSEFTFQVYSKRWMHDDTYKITRLPGGWEVKHIAVGGLCDKGGKPFLFKNFRQDSIQYPSGLAGRMEWLWEQAASKGMTQEEVQTSLQTLADWVSETERNSPSQGIWEGY
jgi:hypothetical protein